MNDGNVDSRMSTATCNHGTKIVSKDSKSIVHRNIIYHDTECTIPRVQSRNILNFVLYISALDVSRISLIYCHNIY